MLLTEFRNNLKYEDIGEKIWEYQINLITILTAITMDTSPQQEYFYTQFNEQAAWWANELAIKMNKNFEFWFIDRTCDDFNCYQDPCDVIQYQHQYLPVQMNATSDKIGNMEAACKLAKFAIDDTVSLEGKWKFCIQTNNCVINILQ